MSLQKYTNNKIESFKNELIADIENKVCNDDRVKWMRETVKSFDTFYLLVDWSGFNDGDEEYPIIRNYFEYESLTDSGASLTYSWDNTPSDEEIEELENLSKADLDKFLKTYNQVCSDIHSFCEFAYDVGDSFSISAYPTKNSEDGIKTLSEINGRVEMLNAKNYVELETLIHNSLSSLDEIKQMKKLVPSFSCLFVGMDWSGFNDGDEEYPIAVTPYSIDSFEYDMGIEGFNKSDYKSYNDHTRAFEEFYNNAPIEVRKASFEDALVIMNETD